MTSYYSYNYHDYILHLLPLYVEKIFITGKALLVILWMTTNGVSDLTFFFFKFFRLCHHITIRMQECLYQYRCRTLVIHRPNRWQSVAIIYSHHRPCSHNPEASVPDQALPEVTKVSEIRKYCQQQNAKLNVSAEVSVFSFQQIKHTRIL